MLILIFYKGMEEEYKYEIFDALLQIKKVEGITMGINIPNPKYEFIRFRRYPYRTKMKQNNLDFNEYYKKLFDYRIFPYLYDYKCIDEGGRK